MNHRNMTNAELLQVVDDLNGHVRPEYVIELAARLAPFADLEPEGLTDDIALAAVAREYDANSADDLRETLKLAEDHAKLIEEAWDFIDCVAVGNTELADLELLAEPLARKLDLAL